MTDVCLALITSVALSILLTPWSMVRTTVLSSALSTLSVLQYTLLQAHDLALTEVAIGTVVTTYVMTRMCRITQPTDVTYKPIATLSLFAIIMRGFLKLHESKISVSAYYVQNSFQDWDVSSCVTAILAGYRGFDTLCETFVLFLAAIICRTLR